MKRLILFSAPTPNVIKQILPLLFPADLEHKVFAYMPPNGKQDLEEYMQLWKGYTHTYNAEFRFIDITVKDSAEEAAKLRSSNILLITGGNTYELLYNLRRSKLDAVVKEFVTKEEYVLAGFSAGSEVVTPTIETAHRPGGMDKNEVGMTDFKALGIVDFTIWPHYSTDQKSDFEQYRQTFPYEVKPLTDEEYIMIEK